MTTAGVTFHTYFIEPQSGQPDPRSPDYELPEALAGYQRTEKTLVVAAVRDSDDIVVGMGGGWLMTRLGHSDVVFVKAAEVNEPYFGTGLNRELIEILMQFSEQQGIHVYIPEDLRLGLAN